MFRSLCGRRAHLALLGPHGKRFDARGQVGCQRKDHWHTKQGRAGQGRAPARIATFKECVSPVAPGTAMTCAAARCVRCLDVRSEEGATAPRIARRQAQRGRLKGAGGNGVSQRAWQLREPWFSEAFYERWPAELTPVQAAYRHSGRVYSTSSVRCNDLKLSSEIMVARRYPAGSRQTETPSRLSCSPVPVSRSVTSFCAP